MAVLLVASCSLGGGSGSGAPPGFSIAFDSAADAGAPRPLRSVRGSGAGTGWAVGEGGLALVLVGSAWREVPSDTAAPLAGLSVPDAGHAFAVEAGGANVLAWNGPVAGAWAPLGEARADRAAAATWAYAPNDVWVVGNGIEHWDGHAWTQQVPAGAAFTSVAGSFDTDIWAVGPTAVMHYDGKTWSPIAIPPGTPALAAVWVTGLLDAWIVGAEGTILRTSGAALVRVTSTTTKNLTSVTGPSFDDVWMGGQDGAVFHWNGSAFTELATPGGQTIDDLWLPPGGDLLLVDDTGKIVRYVR
jgi:hypothetical protein